MFTRIVVAISFLAYAACGGSKPTPASPSPTTPTTGSGNAPVVRVEVKADELSSRDAVLLLSEVVADASGSSGSGPLTFSLDFGDGFVAAAATARHVYSAPGTFTITGTVTDAQLRKVSQSQQITVKSLTGSWFEAEYVQKSQRVEVRRLTVTGQDGLTVRGSYQVSGAADRAFTGTLTAPRHVRIALGGAATLDGAIPGRLNDDTENWILQAHGDTVDGERLEFRPIVGDPTPATPDADFRIRFGQDDWPRPIAAISPIQVDAALSRGTDLTYFIEFGDGYAVSGSSATHVVDSGEVPQLAVRVTVIDRFGRADSESAPYNPFVLNGSGDYWYSPAFPGFRLRFQDRTGANYTGWMFWPYTEGGPATATLGGSHDIRIAVPARGIEFRGEIRLLPGNHAVMMLVQIGGADNARTWTLNLTNEY